VEFQIREEEVVKMVELLQAKNVGLLLEKEVEQARGAIAPLQVLLVDSSELAGLRQAIGQNVPLQNSKGRRRRGGDVVANGTWRK
jgi:hypothetical protein